MNSPSKPVNPVLLAILVSAATLVIIGSIPLYGKWRHEANTAMVMRHMRNPAHTVAFVAMCEYLRVDVPTSLAICNQESMIKQYVWSDYWDRRKKKAVTIARGYMGIHHDTASYIMSRTGIPHNGIADEYDAANNFFMGILHAKYYIEKYGLDKGLEVYNVGEGNYLYKGWRNQKYVNEITNQIREYRREASSNNYVLKPIREIVNRVYCW
jgi:hypothetical protein